MATFVVTAPITMRMNPSHAQRGVASRHFSSTEEVKYSTAISKKMIQKISTSMPCAVSSM